MKKEGIECKINPVFNALLFSDASSYNGTKNASILEKNNTQYKNVARALCFSSLEKL